MENIILKIIIEKLPVVEILLHPTSSCRPADLQLLVMKTCDEDL